MRFARDVPMKHPVKSDFDTAVTETGVTVTFKPTNSIYSFYRLGDTDEIARLGPVWPADSDTRDKLRPSADCRVESLVQSVI
jgi:hypothetical protein